MSASVTTSGTGTFTLTLTDQTHHSLRTDRGNAFSITWNSSGS